LLESTSSSIDDASALAEREVLKRLVPLLMLRLHGPLAETELIMGLGLRPPRDTAGGHFDRWGYDPTRDDARRAWVIEDADWPADVGNIDEEGGRTSNGDVVVRPGARLEASAIVGVHSWLLQRPRGNELVKASAGVVPSAIRVANGMLDTT